MHSVPSQRVRTTGKSAGLVEKRSVAPRSRWMPTLERSFTAPVRYFPALNRTTPPPACSAASRALAMASVSFVFPSPVAPKSEMGNVLSGICGNCGAAIGAVLADVLGAELGAAASAAVTPARRTNAMN